VLLRHKQRVALRLFDEADQQRHCRVLTQRQVSLVSGVGSQSINN
jgi:hypothetical protein